MIERIILRLGIVISGAIAIAAIATLAVLACAPTDRPTPGVPLRAVTLIPTITPTPLWAPPTAYPTLTPAPTPTPDPLPHLLPLPKQGQDGGLITPTSRSNVSDREWVRIFSQAYENARLSGLPHIDACSAMWDSIVPKGGLRNRPETDPLMMTFMMSFDRLGCFQYTIWR